MRRSAADNGQLASSAVTLPGNLAGWRQRNTGCRLAISDAFIHDFGYLCHGSEKHKQLAVVPSPNSYGHFLPEGGMWPWLPRMIMPWLP